MSVLQHRIPHAGLWLLWSFGGWIGGGLLSGAIIGLITMPGAFPVLDIFRWIIISGGIGASLGQWMVFRRYLKHAVWWLPCSVLAWMLGGLVHPWSAGWLISGAVAGAVSGVGAAWLLHDQVFYPYMLVKL